MTYDQALRQAKALDPRVTVTQSVGIYLVTWRRRYQPHLAAICWCTGRSVHEALETMVDREECFRLLKEHGQSCPCEDCCHARIDRSRR